MNIESNDWLGVVPKTWQAKSLKWESVVMRGASPRPIDDPKYFDEDGDYAWVRISDVSAAGMYLETTEQRLSDLGASLSVKLDPGSLFLSIAGSVGKPCITRIKACIHDGFVYFPGWNGEPKFLYYVFASEEPYRGLGKLGTQLNLNTDTVGSIKIGVPPLAEQCRIAAYLDAETAQMDALVAEKEQMLKLLEEKRAAQISHAVTRGLNPRSPLKPSALPWLGDIPKHWEVRRLKWHFREIDDRSETGEEELLSLRMERGLVPHNDVSQKPIKDEEIIGYKRVRTGQLVINRMRSSMGLIAVSPQDGLVSPDYAVFDMTGETDASYYLELFKTPLVGSVFRSASRGMGTGSQGFLRLYSENFLALHFPVPPLEEQRAIVAHLSAERERTAGLEAALRDSIQLLQERRRALITAAVTGQIAIPELSA